MMTLPLAVYEINHINESLRQDGFCFIDYPPDCPSTKDMAHDLGHVFTPPGQPSVQQLCPQAASDLRRHSYSGNFGLDAFPFHSDFAHWSQPPRYILLRAVVADSHVSAFVVHSDHIRSEIGEENLRRSLVISRRKIGGISTPLRLLEGHLFRWDKQFLRSANRTADETFAAMESLPLHDLGTELFLAEGKALIIDNWRCLHARSPVPPESKRVVERAFLKEINT